MKQIKQIGHIFTVLYVVCMLHAIPSMVQAQTPTDIPLTVTPLISPTTTPTPSPTPYTNPGGHQPPGRQRTLTTINTKATHFLAIARDALARMDVAWAHIQNWMTRVQASGKNLTSLAPAVQQVQTKRQAALTAIDTAQAALQQLPATNNPKKTTVTIVTQFQIIRMALKDYHTALVMVIKNIKGMSANIGTVPNIQNGQPATGAATLTPTGQIQQPATASASVTPTL